MHLRSLVSPTLWGTFSVAFLMPLAAHATNGYFSPGYGAKSLGQAGVGIAWSQDALAAAANPAGTAEVGDRFEIGLALFAPRRSAEIVGNAAGADASYSGDGKKNFLVPEFGYTRQLSSTLGVGVAVYGNGGMNTEYERNPYERFGATGTAGVNLEQLFVTPSVAWKPSSDHSIGLGLNVAYQRFSAQGLGVFANPGFSSQPANVSDKGTDSTLGAGVRLGWAGTLAPGLKAGLTWASKIRGRFDEYSGLFADGGRFDVPENYGLGLTWQASTAWTVGADVQTIRYSRVGSVGNSVTRLLQGSRLGDDGGPGFGWRDVTVYKLAGSHRLNDSVVLRAGFSHANQPVPPGETFFNILAPGVMQDHYTLGATWAATRQGELSGFFVYGRGKTVQGNDSIPASFGGGNANVSLKGTAFGLSYAWKL